MYRSVMISIVFISLVFTGCSSTPKRWYKLGATSQMFQRDKSNCENALFSNEDRTSSDFYTFEGCMEGKGWTELEPSP